jgi:predicted alpha/beta superfamily hydrolase
MGHLQIFRELADLRGELRTVRVYFPDAYGSPGAGPFPVLYMQDGQNVFAHPQSARPHTWRANVTLDTLIAEGALEPWLIVGVDHAVYRFEDYTPWDFPQANVIAGADDYLTFLVQRLKPWVDARFDTRPKPEWTAVMGSSLGGLVSLYAGLRRPDVFGRLGGVSPSVMWSDHGLLRAWKERDERPLRIYLDAGTEERFQADGLELDYGSATRDFFTHLKALGYGDHELCLVLEPGGKHHEDDWARRLPFAFRWLLG